MSNEEEVRSSASSQRHPSSISKKTRSIIGFISPFPSHLFQFLIEILYQNRCWSFTEEFIKKYQNRYNKVPEPSIRELRQQNE